MVIWSRVLDCLDCPASASQVTRLIVWSSVGCCHPSRSFRCAGFYHRIPHFNIFFENFIAQTPFHPFDPVDPWRVAAHSSSIRMILMQTTVMQLTVITLRIHCFNKFTPKIPNHTCFSFWFWSNKILKGDHQD